MLTSGHPEKNSSPLSVIDGACKGTEQAYSGEKDNFLVRRETVTVKQFHVIIHNRSDSLYAVDVQSPSAACLSLLLSVRATISIERTVATSGPTCVEATQSRVIRCNVFGRRPNGEFASGFERRACCSSLCRQTGNAALYLSICE
jgi:hypothetical protein